MFVLEAVLLAAAAAVVAVVRMPVRRPAAPAKGAWMRIPGVPWGSGKQLLMGIAVFAPGITATSFVLSLRPSLLPGLLDTTSPVAAGAMAFVMFLTATGAQFAVQRLDRRTILIAGAVSTTIGMGALIVAVRASSVPLLVAAALPAGAGQGMGQLGGLSLLNSGVPASRLAEANAALTVGGYVPAGVLPVTAGYLSDAAGADDGGDRLRGRSHGVGPRRGAGGAHRSAIRPQEVGMGAWRVGRRVPNQPMHAADTGSAT